LNTSETDTLYERLLTENPGNLIYLEEMLELARKLEQERDEAREAFVIATDQMVIAQGKVREANKERDEAREISKAASKGINKTVRLNQFLLSELIAVRKERDELKEIASEFAMTASHCLGWHENKNPNQITSALRRWLKISTNELDA
jgi:predicted house-cleaning NTP pyrophosphatase (Maf/HAM1 superfamily)